MATAREEAAPTFETWKLRLEQAAPEQLREETDRFMQVLSALGTPMIDGAKVHFVYRDAHARDVKLAGEFNDWSRRSNAIQMDRLARDRLLLAHPYGSGSRATRIQVHRRWRMETRSAVPQPHRQRNRRAEFLLRGRRIS